MSTNPWETWEQITAARDAEWDRWAHEHYGLDRWEELTPSDVVQLPGWPS